MKRVHYIVVTAILAFGLIISSALLSNMIYKTNKEESRVIVKGVAEKKIKAEIAKIDITFFTESKTYEEAYAKMVNDKLIITKELDKLKLDNVIFGNLKIVPVSSKDNSKILSYKLTQTITVNIKNMDDIENIRDSLLNIHSEMENFRMSDTEYLFPDIEKYKRGLLEDAVKNSRTKALTILSVDNKELGDLKGIKQSNFEFLNTDYLTNNSEINNKEMYKILRVVTETTYTIK